VNCVRLLTPRTKATIGVSLVSSRINVCRFSIASTNRRARQRRSPSIWDSGKDLHTPTHGRTRQIDTSDFSYGLTHVLLYDSIELAAKCWIIIMSGCPCNKLAHARPIKSTPSGGSSLQSGMLERTPDSSLDTFGPGPLTLIQLGGEPCLPMAG